MTKLIITNKKHIELMDGYNRDCNAARGVIKEAGELLENSKQMMRQLVKKEYTDIHEQSSHFFYDPETHTIEWVNK